MANTNNCECWGAVWHLGKSCCMLWWRMLHAVFVLFMLHATRNKNYECKFSQHDSMLGKIQKTLHRIFGVEFRAAVAIAVVFVIVFVVGVLEEIVHDPMMKTVWPAKFMK